MKKAVLYDEGEHLLDREIVVEPNECCEKYIDGRMVVKIVPHIQRKEPHEDCFVLWIKYNRKRKYDTVIQKGYLWLFGMGEEPMYCREWKTLKGIKGYIEKNYGTLIV